MSYKTRSAILHTLLISLVVFPNLALFPKSAVSPMAGEPPQYALVNMLFDGCLKKKFPNVGLPHVRNNEVTAFDPGSGRNFVWDKDKQAWIDTKTLEAVCPGSRGEPPEYALVNILFDYCLKKKFPNVGLPHVRNNEVTAFDPDSGRNFAWDKDKQVWIDTKTLECICPKCPPAAPAPAAGLIDSCLVGTWRSESLVSEVGYKGGAGIVLTIKPDGLETLDYNGMKPIEGGGETHLWMGIVEAYFTTSKGTATVTKAGKTDLTVKETYRDGRVSERNTKALGPAALGNYPQDRSYSCDGTTLKFKAVLYTATFKREKK